MSGIGFGTIDATKGYTEEELRRRLGGISSSTFRRRYLKRGLKGMPQGRGLPPIFLGASVLHFLHKNEVHLCEVEEDEK